MSDTTAQKDPFYITTAISYVNGSPHLGHAYEVILTDVMARYKRLDGHETYFLTGTDEHGEKVATTAEKNGMQPKDFCDKTAQEFVDMADTLNISNDDFIRTTETRHHTASQAIWKKIEENGDIYLGAYEGWYSVRDEAYFGEDELTTDENTGQKFAPGGAEVVWREEPSYFFKLSAYTDKLLALYEEHPEFIQPESRRNEIISFVKQGLRDLSISRTSFDWGIPVPGNDEHVMYVWLDALTNYITAIGYPDEDSDMFNTFWPADYHVIGKDIIRFHAIYWPAFLMAANLALPKTIFAHGFINVEGQKMSKSVGNVLSPAALMELFGLDGVRYILMREVPHGQDGNFSQEHAVQRVNSDLANGIGNLAQRTLSMIYKNCDETIPAPGTLTSDDEALLRKAREEMLPHLRKAFDNFQFNRGLEVIQSVVSEADAYIDAQAPWKLKKEDPERMKTVLSVLAEVIRCVAIAYQPVIPDSAAKVLDQLKIPADQRDYAHIHDDYALGSVAIDKPEGVFPRIVLEEEAA
ncbi:MAG: methionine--tRNA ligase [Alphaproteobacteria bacterium]|jgi:methionyl-tRNA synthetase|nr:methionine--tRNA ligase [Alphaproteobacteria bacterium]MDP7222666.1 methionine--tRNA ligase [Alphaproteobacteria bacterium]